MARAYRREGLVDEAVFSLFVRDLPPTRNFLLACGLEEVLSYLEGLRFEGPALDYLSTLPEFTDDFLEWLSGLRFEGSVRAVPEGTPVFAGEPLLEIRASLPVAQLVETYVMNQVHLQTLLASKAARVVAAAAGRPVVDFGLRRMHGTDAGLKSARAFYVAGVRATSNLAAGKAYGMPVSGTMGHSYIQAHDSEEEAFRAFASLYPGTTLLVDTYDTLDGVRTVARLAAEAGDGFRVGAIRLDSGDLAALSRKSRAILDAAGLDGRADLRVRRAGRAPGRGARRDGTRRSTGSGWGRAWASLATRPRSTSPTSSCAYGGEGRIKLSQGKELLPGPKQVRRVEEAGRAIRDHLTRADEEAAGRPLLVLVMEGGRRLDAGRTSLEQAAERADREIALLPDRLRSLAPADPPYPVETSQRLLADQARAARRARA